MKLPFCLSVWYPFLHLKLTMSLVNNILTLKFVPFQGLHRLGKSNIPVYDGSWTEWVTHPDTLNIVEVAETL